MPESMLSADSPGPTEPEITRLLRKCAVGDARAAEELLPLVYDQLRRLAQKQMGQERSAHTLQATALVHEAYLRLVGNDELNWDGRAHFYFASAEAMRRILIEHARARARIKRGGDGGSPPRRGLPDDAAIDPEQDFSRILMLDDALRRLETEDPQAANVVRLRYFAGLTVDQTAAAMGLSPSSVDREWAFARARLHRLMQES
jgi:RNA polymerase sigma factor (TIGR02999 family)